MICRNSAATMALNACCGFSTRPGQCVHVPPMKNPIISHWIARDASLLFHWLLVALMVGSMASFDHHVG
jgi:hypothetical protein